LLLNSTAATADDATYWNDTAPTSSVFSIGTNADVNTNTATYVAYCFAEVPGYSKFGSYTGNGSANGPFVWCGFRPAYVMIKRSDSAGEWHIYDTARRTINTVTNWLNADTNGAESGAGNNPVDFLSSGFKLRSSDGNTNASGGNYVFIAFATRPFGGSGVSPAKAR